MIHQLGPTRAIKTLDALQSVWKPEDAVFCEPDATIIGTKPLSFLDGIRMGTFEAGPRAILKVPEIQFGDFCDRAGLHNVNISTDNTKNTAINVRGNDCEVSDVEMLSQAQKMLFIQSGLRFKGHGLKYHGPAGRGPNGDGYIIYAGSDGSPNQPTFYNDGVQLWDLDLKITEGQHAVRLHGCTNLKIGSYDRETRIDHASVNYSGGSLNIKEGKNVAVVRVTTRIHEVTDNTGKKVWRGAPGFGPLPMFGHDPAIRLTGLTIDLCDLQAWSYIQFEPGTENVIIRNSILEGRYQAMGIAGDWRPPISAAKGAPPDMTKGFRPAPTGTCFDTIFVGPKVYQNANAPVPGWKFFGCGWALNRVELGKGNVRKLAENGVA